MAVVLLAKANTDARLGDSADSVSIAGASEGFRAAGTNRASIDRSLQPNSAAKTRRICCRFVGSNARLLPGSARFPDGGGGVFPSS